MVFFPLRLFARIIVEQQNPEHWLAWFSDSPKQIAGGVWPSDALARLVLLFRLNELNTDEVSAIDDATRDGHLEFRIPFRQRWRIPVSSAN